MRQFIRSQLNLAIQSIKNSSSTKLLKQDSGELGLQASYPSMTHMKDTNPIDLHIPDSGIWSS